MRFDLMVGHRRVFALRRDTGELITLNELKQLLYACLADDAAVTLRIHVTEAIDLMDVRAVFAKLYIILMFGFCMKAWNIEIDHWQRRHHTTRST